ncbi:MAG: toxin-antitoxin system toxin subunit [Verrucomicrobia bacterium]|nr:toxin-antitoxin system toxin subunit [Verrucomicrobiota bacterium]
MSDLADILSSKVKAEIFRLLFGVSDRELHLREIERQSGLTVGTVQQELQRLTKLGLIVGRKDGNRLCYSANRDHPLYPDIRNLVLKTSGLVEVLRHALRDKGIVVAFVFGSIASQADQPQSDVDLMVIGQTGLRKLSQMLSGVSGRIGREINPYAMTVAEFGKRKAARDHFLSNVLTSPKLFVTGTEHELETMGR